MHNFKPHIDYKKTNRAVVAVIVGFLALTVLLIVFSQGQARPAGGENKPAKASALKASETFYDFAVVSMAKGNVSKTYKISNPTSQAVTIRKIYTSCMCTKAALISGKRRLGPFGMPGHGGAVPIIDEVLQPGAEVDIEAVFDPAAHGPAGVGPIARTVFVETADGGKLSLDFKANVIP